MNMDVFPNFCVLFSFFFQSFIIVIVEVFHILASVKFFLGILFSFVAIMSEIPFIISCKFVHYWYIK
jgi:hypothetical protein